MITKEKCFKQLREVIDATLSTVDENGNPQSRIIDIMHIEDEKIFFLTARGKDVYKEILNHPKIQCRQVKKIYSFLKLFYVYFVIILCLYFNFKINNKYNL